MANDKKKRREEEEQLAKAQRVGNNVRVREEEQPRVVRNYGTKPFYERLNERVQEKKALSADLGKSMRNDQASFVRDAMSGGIQVAQANQQKRQNQRDLDAAIDMIRSGKLKMPEMKDMAEATEAGHGYKRMGDKAVYTTSFSPLPELKKTKTATRAQAPGAFGISPQEYLSGMKAIREQDAFAKRDAPARATRDTMDNEGARSFLDRWFPEKQGELPTKDEMLAKWSQVAPHEQDLYWMDYQSAAGTIDGHRTTGEADAAAYEEEKKQRQADYDDAIRLLGADAEKYAGDSTADHLARFAYTQGAPDAGEAFVSRARKKKFGLTEADMNALALADRYSQSWVPGRLRSGKNVAIEQMTDQQADTYAILAGVYGDKVADEWYESLLKDEGYNEQAYRIRDLKLREATNQNWLAETGKTFLNVPAQIAGGAYAVGQMLKGEEIDPYNIAFAPTQAVQTPRDETQQMTTRNFGTTDEKGRPKDNLLSWLMKAGYNALTSSGDSLMAGALSLGMPGGGAALQGLWSMGGNAQDATMRGANTTDAVLLSGMNAVIEGVTEYLPMDNLIKTIRSGDIRTVGQILKNALKAGLKEAPGEGLSELGSYVSDKLIMGKLSNWDALVAENGEAGAALKVAGDVLTSAFTGFLSGAGSTTLAGTGAAVHNRIGGETDVQTENATKPEQQTAQDEAQVMTDAAEEDAQKAAETNEETQQQTQNTKGEERPKVKFDTPKAAEKRENSTLRVKKDAVVTRNGNAQEMTIAGVEAVSNGNVFLRAETADGETEVVSAGDVEFADPVAQELLAMKGVNRMNPQAVRAYLDGYDANIASPEEYAAAYESAYEDGRAGLEYERMLQVDRKASTFLTSETRLKAYAAGLNENNQRTAEQAPAVQEAAQTEARAKESGVELRYSREAWDLMSKERRRRAQANIELASVIGKRMNRKIAIVDEVLDNNGKSANGAYNPETGEIQVALNADAQAYGYVAMHELVHVIKTEHADEWHDFENFVAAVLEKDGKDLADLTQEQMERYGLDAELAMEEVICNTVPGALLDEQNLLSLYKGNRTLFERVMDWVNTFIGDIKKAGEALSKGNADWKQMDALKMNREDAQKILQMMEGILNGEGKEKDHSGTEGGMAGDANVIKLSKKESEYDPETAAIKQQIANSSELLNSMEVVAHESVPEKMHNKRAAGEWAIGVLKSTGYQVDRQGFGVIKFDEDDIRKAMNYANTEAEKAAIAALPKVLKRGIEIGRHNDHKKRAKQTVTFAAPVELNGVRGNMAVVVNMNRNHYYTHRIVLPDGSVFKFGEIKKETVREPQRGVTVSSSLANATSTASNSSIASENENVNGKFSRKAMTDTDGNDLSEEQQAYFSDSKVRDTKGSLKVMHHGTANDFTVFNPMLQGGKNGVAEGYGIYFTDTASITDTYGGKRLSGYLNITHPARSTEKTIRPNVLAKLIQATCEAEAEKWVADGDYDSKEAALKDTWVSNYEYTYDSPMSVIYRKVASSIIAGEDSDMGIVQEVMAGTAVRDYEGAYEFYDLLKETTGIDGFITEWDNAEIPGGKAMIALAFDSNQFKNLDNKKPTTDPDIRYSRKGLDPDVDAELEAAEAAFEQVRYTHRITAAEADELAGKILKEANSEYDRQETAQEIAAIFDYIERADAVDMDHVDEMETRLMARVMEKSKVLDYDHEDLVKPIREYFKKVPIALSKNQKEEAALITGSYATFRRKLMGRVKLTNSGLPLEKAWQELHDMLPEWFPEDTNEGDMPDMLMQVVDAMKPVYETPMNIEETASWMAGKLNEMYLKLPAVKAGAKNRTVLGQSVQSLRRAMTQFAEANSERFGEVLAELEAARKTSKDESDKEAWAELRRQYDEWKEKDADEREERFQLELKKARNKLTAQDLAMRSVYTRVIMEGYKRQRMKDDAARRERELVNKQRARTEATVRTLTNWLEKPTDAKHVPQGLDEPLKNLLTSLDFGGKNTKAATQLSERLDALADAMAGAQEQDEESRTLFLERDQQMIDELHRVARMIKGTANGRGVYELNGLELKDLNKWLGVVKHMLVNASKLRGSNLGDLKEVALASEMEIGRKKPMKNKKWIEKRWEQFFGPDMMDSFTFFERLGPTSNLVFKNLRKGFDKMAQLTRQAEQHTQKLLKDANLKNLSGKKAEKVRVEVHGREIEMTKAQMMELYVLSKRPQAQGHLYGGGFRIRGDEDAHPHLVDEHDVAQIISKLTDKEKKIADGLQEFLSMECAKWGNETSMRLVGYEKFGEENYWPITTDSNQRATNKLEENFAANINAIKNQGMTKQLVEGAKNAIIVGDIFDTYTQHISNMSAYAAYAVPLSDVQRWLNAGGVKTEIEHVMGKKGLQYINNFLMAVNGSAQQMPKSGLEKAAGVMARNAKTAAVGGNLRVIVQQPTSYARAALMMHPKYLTEALKKKAPKADVIDKYCSIAAWKRYGFYETNVGPGLREMIVGDASRADKAREIMMRPAAWGDNWTMNRLWVACELETADLYPELERNSDEFLQKVGDRMSEVIDRTQVVDSVFHRSQMMRSKNYLAQTLTNFMSEPTKTFNMLTAAIYDYADNRKNKAARARVARAFGVWVATAALTAAAASIVDAFRDDDMEKEWLEKYKDAAQENLKDSLNPLGMLPLVKDVLSIVEGYDPSRLDQQSIQKIMWAYQEVEKYIAGESKQSLYGVSYKIAQAMSSTFGIPIANALRDINAIYQTVTGDSPTLNAGAKKGATINKLYEAMTEGDAKRADALRAKLKKDANMNPKEIDTAIAEKLSHDERIKAAWEARADKRIGDVNRTKNALAHEGFTGEMVDKAILEYGSRVTPKEEKQKDPDAQLKAKLYSYDDAEEAVRKGASVEDVKLMLSDMAADSTAKDPEKSVRSEMQSRLKKMYLEALSKGDTAGMRSAKIMLTEAVGTAEETITSWEREQHTADLKEAVDAYNTTAAVKAVSVMRKDGKTDSQIKSSLSKYKWTYVEAYERGDMATANRIKKLLVGLGLKGKNGDPLYDEDTFAGWLK